jgi:hypothetical protein
MRKFYRLPVTGILAFLIISLAPHALSVEWFNIGTTSTGEYRYIDIDSIKTNGDYVYYWSRTVYPQKTSINEARFFWAMNCASGTGSLQSYIQVGKNDEVIDMQTYNDYSFNSIPPDSIGDFYLKFACNWATALNNDISTATLKEHVHQYQNSQK